MKIKTLWIILALMIGIVSCKKQNVENFEEAMSITELFNYTGGFANVSCDEELPHAYDTVTVFGWISEPEETQYANYFMLYDSETGPSKEVDVFASANSPEIFRKINKKTHGSGLIQIWILGKIVPFQEIFVADGSCKLFVRLEIDDVSDIQF